MTRVLAVKAGNAETTLGLFDDGRLLGTWATSSAAAATVDEAAQVMRTFLQVRDVPQPEGGIVCSVVPMHTFVWVEALRELTGTRPLIVGPGLKSGIAMGYKDPGQMGADRVAGAVAAKELYGAPVVVADFGTASTFTVVGREGALLGGIIAPGVRVSLEALSGSAAQLAEVGMQVPRQVVGRTTADAMRSGIVFGEAARADGLVAAIWDELGYETSLVAAGRYARFVCPAARHGFEIREDLVLQGLRLIYDLNAKAR